MNILKSTFLVALLMSLMSFKGFENIKDGSHKILLDKSKVSWVGEKVTGKHEGTIGLKSGNLMVENGELIGGSFEIDMTTILVTDLEGEYKGKLEGHLKSDDFFGVEKYPAAKFNITNISKREGNGNYKVAGKVTIKDVTKQIEFDAKVKEASNGLNAVAEIVIDRSDFNVRYGSGSFFDNLGDNMIYDNFTLQVDLTSN